jgi:hypothetical protein
MLIWKVIAANPGIARSEIVKRVERGIPAGYAGRRFAHVTGRPKKYAGLDPSGPAYLRAARSYVLSCALSDLKRGRNVYSEGPGRDLRYTAIRPPLYFGNADAIDADGDKAGEHMAVADALRTAEKMLGRAKPDSRSGPIVCVNRREYEALVLVVKALRAKGSTA